MLIKYLMKSPAIVLFPSMSIKEAGEILTEHHISGAPVVDRTSHDLVGIVSESDLLTAGTAHHGTERIAELMTTDVVIADGDHDDVRTVAGRMVESGVHRVPVVHGRKVIGIISRYDLLKHMCRPDGTLADEVARLLRDEGSALARLKVEVADGVVNVSGDADSGTHSLALQLAQSVPGVLDARLTEADRATAS